MLDEKIHVLMDARDMSLFHLFIELYSCQASGSSKNKKTKNNNRIWKVKPQISSLIKKFLSHLIPT